MKTPQQSESTTVDAVRVVQGEPVTQQMTVTRQEKSTRTASGKYQVHPNGYKASAIVHSIPSTLDVVLDDKGHAPTKVENTPTLLDQPQRLEQKEKEHGGSDAATIGSSEFLRPPTVAETLQVPDDLWGLEVNGLRAALVKSAVLAGDEHSTLLTGAVVVKNVTRYDHIRFEEWNSNVQPFLVDGQQKVIRVQDQSLTEWYYHVPKLLRRTILAPGEHRSRMKT